MEIVDFLRSARKRLWLLIAVPLVAAGVTGWLVMSAPPQFTANGTVSPPALIGGSAGNQYTGSQAVSQYVAAFQATAQGPVVRQEVATKVGLPASQILDGLTVTQVGASSAMTISFTDANGKVVEPVVAEVARETLQTMFGSQVSLARGQVSAAQQELAKANAAIVAWEKKNGMVAPDRIYQSKLDLINSLQQQQTSLLANGNKEGAAAVAAKVASARSDLGSFGPILAEYGALTASRDAATAALTQAQAAVQNATAQEGAADPTQVAFIGGSHPVGNGSLLLSKVLPVTGAAIFVAVFLVAMLELLSRSRAVRREEKAHAGRHETGVAGDGVTALDDDATARDGGAFTSPVPAAHV